MTGRSKMLIAAGAIAALATSFGAGRLARPAKVETRVVEKEVVKWQTRVEYRESAAAKAETHEVIKRVYVPVQLPGGQVATQVTETIGKETAVETKTERASEAIAASETVREKTVVKFIEARPPNWTAGALVGWDSGKPVYGGIVSRRILGSIELGAWATTTGLQMPIPGGALLVRW